jgi:hypothetical protein
MEGVGEERKRDSQGRYYILSRKQPGDIDPRTYLEPIFLLLYTYGSVIDLAEH